MIRETLESTLGTSVNDKSWQQAQLNTTAGGLGLRSTNNHSPAAFLASSTCSNELCQKLDPDYAWDGLA